MKKDNLPRITDIWALLERGKNYNRMQQLYENGQENYDYFFGRQWGRLKKPTSESEPITLNIVKPIVKYKVNIINQNSYKIVFNPNVYNTQDELKNLKNISKGLSQFINRMWEKSQTGKKVRSIVKTACINSEGILYFYTDENDLLNSEVIEKNNIYYGNESESDIQNQPYILIVHRKTIQELREVARKYREQGVNNLTDEEIENIVSDTDYNEQQNKDKMIMEVTPMCNMVTKFEKRDGQIWVSSATKYCEIIEPQNTECELYPLAHFLWEEEYNYARGISEVSQLLENQREINKTATRRAISVKLGAYPKLAVDTKYVTNPEALDEVGSTIELYDMRADDVRKVVSYLNPAQMSSDAYNLQADLINMTKDLAGAGDTATGNVDPTQASGKAILAVQQAIQQPLNEQKENYMYFLEDCAKIIFELIKVNYINGLTLYTNEDEINELGQTERIETPFTITQEELENVDLDLKVDITPQGVYDKYAQEVSLENLLLKGLITLEEYTEALPEDSTMPKPTLEDIIRKRKEARNKITEIQQQANALHSAIQQTMIEQGGIENEMSQMPMGGNENGVISGQQVPVQMR